MLRDYELALQNYRLLSTDYKLDKAWKRYAGVQVVQVFTNFNCYDCHFFSYALVKWFNALALAFVNLGISWFLSASFYTFQYPLRYVYCLGLPNLNENLLSQEERRETDARSKI